MKAGSATGVWLVIRAQPGADATAARITAQGGRALAMPLFTIAPSGAAVSLAGVQAVAFTSAHGARALPPLPPGPIPPAFAVGETTAAAARGAGFMTVTAAEGDGASLAALLTARLAPQDGPVLIVRGADQAFDLKAALEGGGFSTVTHIAYAAKARISLTPEESDAARTAAGVFIHSARGAQAAAALLEASAPQLCAVCISAAAAAPLQGAGFQEIRIAQTPSEEAMLALAFAQTDAQG